MNTVKNKNILVDSCILLYCETYIFKDQIRKLLRELSNNNNKLGISEFSGFEVLKNAKPKYSSYFVKLLNHLQNFPVDKKVLLNAVKIFKFYETKKINNPHKINPGDYIVGGTCILLKNPMLLTTNIKDFPKSLWIIHRKDKIVYEKGDKFELLNIYLLEPNISKLQN